MHGNFFHVKEKSLQFKGFLGIGTGIHEKGVQVAVVVGGFSGGAGRRVVEAANMRS